MQDLIRDASCRTTMVSVDSYERKIPSGHFYNYGQGEDSRSFTGLTQLLMEIEHILDSTNYPQSFTALRSFSVMPEPKQESTADSKHREGKLATFVIKVLFRQHTSWQGSITWLETQSEQTFRSVLELILLMDSALGSSQKGDQIC